MSDAIVRRADHGRVAVLEMDYPGRSVNVVDERLLRDLAARVAEVNAEPEIDAIVLASAKRSFGAGADIEWLPELAQRPDAEAFLAWVHDFMVSLVEGPKPVVAAVNGYAFGGALELVLGAQSIIAAEGTRIGLPEVTLGLLPGGGGTQLLPRFASWEDSAELLTSGRTVSADDAERLGLVQEITAPGDLRNRAVAAAELLVASTDRRGWPLHPHGDELSRRRKELQGSRGGISLAADTVLSVLEAGATLGAGPGLRAERRDFLDLLASAQARAAIHLFTTERRARAGGDEGWDLGSLAVVGGGQMGAGIAATAVTSGIDAVVRDVGEDSLDRARGYLDKVVARRAARGAKPVDAQWRGTTEWEGFDTADLIVEAVFEKPELKEGVLAETSRLVGADAVLATNTSAISIERLAGSVKGPEHFLGMHFFSPVERMPLVEMVPHSRTDTTTVARASAAVRSLGKIGVTVGDAPGFFTSRVYARWLIEGVRLLLDGVPAEQIDAAAKSVGFPVGPLQAHDEATLQLVIDASIGQVAEQVMGDRLDVGAARTALETLVGSGIRGRRHGFGFYEYDAETGKRVGVNPRVGSVLGVLNADPKVVEDASSRLLLAFVTECLLCWDDGTLCHPDDGDLASVLGIGFPRNLGGPFHWADEQGAAEVVEMCRELDAEAFPAGSRLSSFAASGGRFGDEARRTRPFESSFTSGTSRAS
ncbi:MAG: 3-hydroxyacyl-CoA dehydrogenase NAD-binding domain-containing protein [Actinomycetia bacterium]|nr:3-hydroxyacyl-CoA dehydrogenase NAD-binding domain-containing protein [Actinomycetes bacterium]